ncbi:MAG: selenide, water dikinase SelD [Omnitrophica WOR_2 bacterium]
MKAIYLDYNATTPIDKEVAEEMIPYITEFFGNPSSSHTYGIQTRMAVEKAREQTATMLNCKPYEIFFTGGGTESNNMAIKGVASANSDKGKHIIISAVEHPAVSEVAEYLRNIGFEVSIAKVDETGLVDPKTIESLIRSDTILISVMHANNEVGTIQPISEISSIAHKQGILMHSDAAQSVGKIEVDVRKLGIDLLSIAGHKLYAPKGIGALYIKRGTKIEKYMHGANHEQDMRPGTENVSHIVALGKACELVKLNLDEYAKSMLTTKNRLCEKLIEHFPDLRINGNKFHCLPNTLNVSFRNLSAGTIMSKLSEVAVSAGAACHSSSGKSGTLEAMNLPAEYALGAMRITTGRYTTNEEVDKAVQLIAEAAGVVEPVSEVQNKYSITEYAHGMGCGCKMRPADLEFILKDLSPVFSPDVIVGAEHRDDAAVYRFSGNDALVQTVDFFTPMVEDPYTFGAIAAANALSDIYAMGATPLFALNMVAFPVDELPLNILKQIMQGASDKAKEANIPILGGHSIEDTGIKFGMVVSGRVKTSDLITNSNAKVGDSLILTKPIGSGIMTKALSLGFLNEDDLREAIDLMKMLNKIAAEVMKKYRVNACTDITGFGLTGHLHEITLASSVDAELFYDEIPFLDKVERMAVMGAIPGSTKANETFASEWTDFTTLTTAQRFLVCDSQTSGGLLICLESEQTEDFLDELKNVGVNAFKIGKITGKGTGKIKIGFNSL